MDATMCLDAWLSSGYSFNLYPKIISTVHFLGETPLAQACFHMFSVTIKYSKQASVDIALHDTSFTQMKASSTAKSCITLIASPEIRWNIVRHFSEAPLQFFILLSAIQRGLRHFLLNTLDSLNYIFFVPQKR